MLTTLYLEQIRQHGTSDLDHVTNEQLEELRRTVLAWVGGNGTNLKPVAVSPSAPAVSIDKERLRDMLRALILRDATPEEIELVIAICEKYGFDPRLRHIVLISGQIYVTRDGLLHLAHASGQLDGIEVEAERDADGKWIATARVYRKDMQRPFVYSAHQAEHENPASKAWQKAPRAMTIKCAEVMALRRAFAVALAGAEEIGYEGEQE